jgi:hypothetical protein
MSIVMMISETCYHPSIKDNRYDDKGNLNIPMATMSYNLADQTLTCPTCGQIEHNVRKVDNYPGHEEGRISHGAKCPHHNLLDTSGKHSPECTLDTPGQYQQDRCYGPFGALYMQTSHVGVVLSEGEHNFHDDSNFYAVVWNSDKGCTEQVQFATTRGWTYPNHCKVDATPEVIAAWQAWSEVKRQEYLKRDREEQARKVSKGKMVVVARGRKVPKGTTGIVFWYGAGQWGDRVGVKDSRGTVHWTAAVNCDVILSNQEKLTG